MKITAIKAQVKNENRVSIFLDGKYSFSLTLDQLLEQRLKKHDELDEVKIKNLKKLSDEGKLKARTMEWLLGRPHSTREFRDYLFRKRADKDLIEAWVEEFTEKAYLNDEQFTRWFVEKGRRKHKSARAIQSELASKGIQAEFVRRAAEESNEDSSSDKDSLRQLVRKIAHRSRYQDEQKLKVYLLGKGFSYNLVKEVLAEEKEDL